MDRYGKPTGEFTSPIGESNGRRALPSNTDFSQGNYHVYKVVDDIDVQIGKSTPWFDQPGGAIQFKLPKPVEDLLFNEKLIELRK